MQLLKTNVSKPIEFVSGGQFISDIPWTHSRRMIDSYEIIIGVKEILYIQQDDTHYEVKPGDVLLLLPNLVHQGFAPSVKGISFYWFHFICPEELCIVADHTLAEEYFPLPALYRVGPTDS